MNNQEWEEWYYRNVILPEQFPDSPIYNDQTIIIGKESEEHETQRSWLKDIGNQLYLLPDVKNTQGENEWVSFRY
jgi:hypothetical protein